MKSYPSISSRPEYGGHWYVFDKLDGSNIRAEWSRKKNGFYKFGSRKQLIGGTAESEQQTILARAEGLIRLQEDVLTPIFRARRWDRVVCFFEFFGPSSFAGMHDPAETQQVVLFDVDAYKRGIIGPKEFVEMFADAVPTPALLQRGTFNHDDEAAVRAGVFPGVTSEGIVAKAPRTGQWEPIRMFKVKNQAWIDKVRAQYGTGAEAYI